MELFEAQGVSYQAKKPKWIKRTNQRRGPDENSTNDRASCQQRCNRLEQCWLVQGYHLRDVIFKEIIKWDRIAGNKQQFSKLLAVKD